MKNVKASDLPHIRARIEQFKQEVRNANSRGIEILPSVNGPYAFKDGVILGVKGTSGYKNAVS